MALFFAFKATCNETAPCPSEVILGGVDMNSFEVQVRRNDGLGLSKKSQGEGGEVGDWPHRTDLGCKQK
jgi:hypothetical protein